MKWLLSTVMALGVVLLAGPASAADEIGLSRNGVTFTSSLNGSLFDPAFTWVPGDVESETFYVRNQGGDTARLTVDIVGEQVSDLIESGDLQVTASSGNQAKTVSSAGDHRLLNIPDIEADEIVPVTVTVAFDDASTNETQLLSSDLTFRINLSQTSTVLGEDDNDGNGALPDTGAPSLWIFGLGSVLLGTGVAIVSRRRETQQGESHV
jgi:LPXTG-motif cell wall-anchored protein